MVAIRSLPPEKRDETPIWLSRDKELTADMLAAMSLSAEMGNYRALHRMFVEWDGVLSSALDGNASATVERLREILLLQWRLERRFGQGAALELDHPIVQDWSTRGLIRNHRVEAAAARVGAG